MTRADSFTAQAFQRGFAEIVAAYVRHKFDTRPGARRGHRLVRAFAARNHGKPAVRDGFARTRQSGHAHDQVRVRAADDDEAGVHALSAQA